MNAIANIYFVLLEGEIRGAAVVFKRHFLSGAVNQPDMPLALTTENSDYAPPIVEQLPLSGTGIVLWVYLQSGVQTRVPHSELFEVRHGAYRHLWSGSAFNCAANSKYQTHLSLNSYAMQLMEQGYKLADNCIRIWFFVQNMDVNYAGTVKIRNEVFIAQNLTEKTHYISSIGISGCHADPRVSVLVDIYIVDGTKSGQVYFLYAPAYPNSAYEYGVSFEHGTYVDYGDHRQIFISGTASINNKDEMMRPGNIRKRTEWIWENMKASLKEAGCTLDDLEQMTVCSRDITNYAIVKEMYDRRSPITPKVFIHAPVCRSG